MRALSLKTQLGMIEETSLTHGFVHEQSVFRKSY
jgi:hypothetical protein